MNKRIAPLATILLLCLLPSCAKVELRNGIYHGSATGYTGRPVTATIVVEDGGVTELVIDTSGDSPGVGGGKGPALSYLILQDGVPGRTDVITGATVTSKAAKKAYRRAYRKAAGKQSTFFYEGGLNSQDEGR